MSKEKALQPALRFNVFEGDWVTSDFQGTFSYISNNSLSRAALNERAGLAKNIHYGDILIKFGEVLDISANQVPYITNDSLAKKLIPNRLKNGDIVIADAAEDSSVGKCTEIINLGENILFSGLHTIAVRPTTPFAPKYLGYFLNSDCYHDQLLSLMQGIKVLSISKSAIKDTFVRYPQNQVEQKKIGDFFQHIDQQLKLHQLKYTKLQQLKKAMLGKMFPKAGAKVPEMRFTGFSGDWETKVFKDSFNYIANNSLSRAQLNDKSGLAMNVHYGDVLIKFDEVLDVFETNIPYISNEALVSNLMPNCLQNGDIVIADAAEDTSVGKCTEIYNLGEQLLFAGLHTIAIRPSTPFAPKYLGYFLNSNLYHDQLIPIMQGTKVLSISKSSIKETLIYYPNDLAEQTKIGNYFHNLDRLIVLQQQHINKLKNIKQACLEKMFV